MSGEIIVKRFEMTTNDVKHLATMDAKVEALNRHIIKSRKKIIHESLMESTRIRTDVMKKIKTWIEVIETRLFDPATIAELDINKVLSLFKVVTAYSVKMFGQITQLENLLKSYLDAERMSQEFNKTPNRSDDETNNFKRQLSTMLLKQLSKTAENIMVTPTNLEQETNDEQPDRLPIETEVVKKPESSEDLGTDISEILKPI